MLLYHLQTRTVQSKRYPEEVLTTCSATEERFMCWLLRFVGLPLTKCAFPAKSFRSSTGGSGVPRNLATRQQKQSRGRAGAGTHGGETTQGLKRSRNQLCECLSGLTDKMCPGEKSRLVTGAGDPFLYALDCRRKILEHIFFSFTSECVER